MRSDHLSKHVKTHQKGSRLNPATSSTSDLMDDMITAAEADQSDLSMADNVLQMGDGDSDDEDDDSGSDISEAAGLATNGNSALMGGV